MGVNETQWDLIFWKPVFKKYCLRATPTLTHDSDIVSDNTIWNYILGICPDILSAILSGIYSDILSDILSGVLSGISSGILSGR